MNIPEGNHAVRWIMLALLIWGTLLATSAFINGRSLMLERAAIIFGCTVLFLSFWWAMLAHRNWKLRRRQEQSSTK
jgi:high-affinity Fe2+/Pb2+ permease